MVIPFIEEEEEVEEIEEEENGYKKGRWRDLPIGETVKIMVRDLEVPLLPVYPKRTDKMMNGQCQLPLRGEKVQKDKK